MRIANCVVTKNGLGIFALSNGGGIASVIGTSPGNRFYLGQ